MGALSKEERKKVRKNLGSLKQLTVQPKTRERYSSGLQSFFQYLKREGLNSQQKETTWTPLSVTI